MGTVSGTTGGGIGNDYFSDLTQTVYPQTCIDCSCKQVPLNSNTCNALHDLNDEKVLGASKVLADAELCDYTKIFPKILYSLWCMIKNIIATLCWLLTRVSELERKVINICKTLACVVEYVKKKADEEMIKAFKNVSFTMSSKGENNGPAYTVVTTNNNGSFTVKWNMFEGSEIGHGTLTGKVNHTYSVNTDGSIKASIMSVTLSSLVYNGSSNGTNTSARFVIYDRNGKAIIDKSYNPYKNFSDTLNKTITYNFNYSLAPNGGTSGDVLLLKTLDDWVMNDTTSSIYAKYTNNNEPVDLFNCDGMLDCL